MAVATPTISATAVWVMNEGDGTISRIDPATDSVTATILVATRPVQGGDIAVGGGFVWARISDQLVAKVDPTTNDVVARYGPEAGSGSVAADDTAAWVSAHDVNAVWRLPLE
jgi:virginiamycin B lyase